MNTYEFSQMVFNNQDVIKKYESGKDELKIDEKYLAIIAGYLKNIEDIEKCKIHFNDIISKPNMDNGKLYELLLYSWLKKTFFDFKEQVEIQVDECLKKSKYDADGELYGIIFEVKKFGVGFHLFNVFREKLQNLIPDYHITISGNKDLCTDVIRKEYIDKVENWKEKLLSDNSRIYDDYIVKCSKHNIEIRAHNKNQKTFISFSEIDITRWAKENELYFFHHASQFCCNKPYILFCPFFPKDIDILHQDDVSLYYAFRFLCRRMFMNVTKMNDRLLKEYDTKAKDNITLAAAAKKLSAVIFIDISEEWDYNNSRCWIYTNPNADNKIPKHIMNSKFNQLNAHIVDFKNDNY